MTLIFGEVWNLTLQHMQGKCASIFWSLLETPDKLFRNRMIKEKANSQHMPWWGNTHKIEWLKRIIQGTKAIFMFSKTLKNPSIWAGKEWEDLNQSYSIFLIIQYILVDTWKFTGSGEAWNNFYAYFKSRRWTHLVLRALLEDEQRTMCGGVCWRFLTHTLHRQHFYKIHQKAKKQTRNRTSN